MISYKKAHELLLAYTKLLEKEKMVKGKAILEVRAQIRVAQEEYTKYMKENKDA